MSAVCGAGPPAGRFSRPTRWPVPPRQEGFVIVDVGDGGPRRTGFGALVRSRVGVPDCSIPAAAVATSRAS